MSAGKGDDRRPQFISDEELAERWAMTFAAESQQSERAREAGQLVREYEAETAMRWPDDIRWLGADEEVPG